MILGHNPTRRLQGASGQITKGQQVACHTCSILRTRRVLNTARPAAARPVAAPQDGVPYRFKSNDMLSFATLRVRGRARVVLGASWLARICEGH